MHGFSDADAKLTQHGKQHGVLISCHAAKSAVASPSRASGDLVACHRALLDGRLTASCWPSLLEVTFPTAARAHRAAFFDGNGASKRLVIPNRKRVVARPHSQRGAALH